HRCTGKANTSGDVKRSRSRAAVRDACGPRRDQDTLGAVSNPERNDAPDDRVYDPPRPQAPAVDAESHAGLGHLDPRRWRVFGLTCLSYASYYLTRKNFAIAKPAIQNVYGFTTTQLGYIDSTYAAAYALGQFVWGAVADRYGPRRVIGFGMLASALF